MSWYSFMPKLFNMSLTAGVVICIVLILRLVLKKAPKVVSYALWSVVLFRLLCPISIESDFSLFNLLDTPTKEAGAVSSVIEYVPENIVHTEYPAVTLPIPGISDVINDALPQGQEQLAADPLEAPTSIVTYIWMIGVLVMVIYSTVSYIRLHQNLLSSVKLQDNIFLADSISSPFVIGLIRPKIYLPSSLSEKERDYIILHEQHHIRRGDHIIKLLSFAALCLHWFNPLVWLAFILSGKDMEMSCDEAVLRKLGGDIRADYSASLISLATGRRIIAGAPLAFGEGDTEGRVKNIAGWKKPAVWVIVVAVIVCVVLAVCLITNPMNRDTMLLGAEYRIAETLYSTGDTDYTDNDSPSVCITADYCLWERHGDNPGEWRMIGQLEPYALMEKELDEYTAYKEGWRRRYNVGEITDAYILRDSAEEESMFFLAIQTKSGDTLLGFGFEDLSERGQGASDDTSLYWLCRLESTFGGTHLTGEFHERSLAQTVGGDVEIFHTHYDERQPNYMIVAFQSDDSPYEDGVQLPSHEKTDMGFAVFYQNKDKSGFMLLQTEIFEDAALSEDGIFLCDIPAIMTIDGRKPETTYDVILLNNERIEKVTCTWESADGKTITETQTYLSGHEMVLFSRENYTENCRISYCFYDEDGTVLAEKTTERLLKMTPTTANITGAFDGYLYVPIDGATYRYEIIFDDPASVTCGKLMYTFTEEADPNDVEWRVYAVDDYPDRTVVLAEAGEDYVHLYRYSPSKAVDPSRLIAAKTSGMITLEDGYATYEQKLWTSFYLRTQDGESASVKIAHYHTLENGNYSGQYLEAYKEDYPSLSTYDLAYDGKTYTLKWNDNGTQYERQFKYLRKFEVVLPSYQSSKKPETVTRYVLTNNSTASWDELWMSLASSQLGDYIDHCTIYSEKN